MRKIRKLWLAFVAVCASCPVAFAQITTNDVASLTSAMTTSATNLLPWVILIAAAFIVIFLALLAVRVGKKAVGAGAGR